MIVIIIVVLIVINIAWDLSGKFRSTHLNKR
jgi:hypothetical protein